MSQLRGTVLRLHKTGKTDVLLMNDEPMTVDTSILTKVTTLHVNQQAPPPVPPAA